MLDRGKLRKKYNKLPTVISGENATIDDELIELMSVTRPDLDTLFSIDIDASLNTEKIYTTACKMLSDFSDRDILLIIREYMTSEWEKGMGDEEILKFIRGAFTTGLPPAQPDSTIPQNIQNDISDTFSGLISTSFDIATILTTNIPIYYDKSKNWWMWDRHTLSYRRIDETDLLVSIMKHMNIRIYKSQVKGEVLDSLKLLGRRPILEPDINWVQFKNTVYDIKKRIYLSATPEYFFTSPIPHNIGRSAETPTIDRLFNEWYPENPELLFEIMAYCLYDGYPIQRMFAIIGSGSNGKGQFMTLLQNVLGVENCVGTDLEMLTKNQFASSKLYKKKAAFIGELNYTTISKTDILKKLTGGDMISGEFKGKDSFDFINTAKLIMASNGLPQTTDMSDGFYRRWCTIEFKSKFADGKSIVNTIPEREYENLCFKLMHYLTKIIDSGTLPHEPKYEERKRIYDRISNPIEDFINTCCEPGELEFCPFWLFFNEYDQYRINKGVRAMTKAEIGRILKSHGYKSADKTYTPNMLKRFGVESDGNKTWSTILGFNLKEYSLKNIYQASLDIGSVNRSPTGDTGDTGEV